MFPNSRQLSLPLIFASWHCLQACSDSSFSGGTKIRTKQQDSPATGTATFQITHKPETKVSDAYYLFVLDNSVSMVQYAVKVATGLTAIPESIFPPSTHLGVITTMAAKTTAARETHADILRYAGINQEPGFLKLIDQPAIAAFKNNTAIAASHRNKYAIDGCDQGWFGPYATNSQGHRCFQAALQNPFTAVGCEPGLLAAHQFIEISAADSLFRDGAAVNIVFISDEQDGCNSTDTKAGKSFSEIKDAITRKNSIKSLKIHGIVPATAPAGNTSYKNVIEESGGQYFNIADNAADYRTLIQTIIENGSIDEGTSISLPQRVTAVSSVTVDGMPIAETDYRFDGMATVEIFKLSKERPSEIEIRYLP